MSEPAQAGMLKRRGGVETPSSTGRGTTGIGSGARSTDEIEFRDKVTNAGDLSATSTIWSRHNKATGRTGGDVKRMTERHLALHTY